MSAATTSARAAQRQSRPARRSTQRSARPLLRVIGGGLERVPSPGALQSIVQGRAFVLFVAILLAGLVFININRLKAGDGYGNYVTQSTKLERENSVMRERIAQLSSSERIQQRARGLGFVMPTPEQFRYLSARSSDPLRAARGYTVPAVQIKPISPTVQILTTTGTPAAATTPSAQSGAPSTPPINQGGQANAAPQGGAAAPQSTGNATNGAAGGQ